MEKLKNSKGITLIALIITIIVMLILVAVTINVALNGGLFDRAKNARDLTQKQVEKEELMIAALGAYDEKTDEVNLSKLEESINNLSNVYTDKSVESSKYVLTGPSGTKWQIDLTTAEVTEYKESTPEPDPDPEPEPAEPIQSLQGKTFDCPIINSPIMVSTYGASGIFAMTFDESTWEMPYEMAGSKLGEGTYTYSDNTIHLEGTVMGSSIDETFPLYTIEKNGAILEYYFIMGTQIYTEYGNTNFLVPFTGEFTNAESGKSVTFSVDNNTGYGIYNDTSEVDQYYCYDVQNSPNIIYVLGGGECKTQSFSYTLENGECTSVTINGTTYTKQS